MTNFIKKNFIYILFALVIFLILFSFIFVSLTKKPSKQVENPTSPPSVSGPQPGKIYSAVTEENITEGAKSKLVSKLTGSLPYQGKNFYLEYFYSNFTYQLTYYSGKEDQGEKEFEQYLKDNQVEDKSWLKRLVIKVI